MKVRILSCAEAELAAAVDYYNEQYPGSDTILPPKQGSV